MALPPLPPLSRRPARWQVPLTSTSCERLAELDFLAWEAAHENGRIHMIAGYADGKAGSPSPDVRAADRAAVARAILATVQQLPQVPDQPGAEIHQTVDYTLDHGGDCEDAAVVLVAAARAACLRARLVWVDQKEELESGEVVQAPLNHVTSQILIDGMWVWADASIHGARLGEDPYDAAKRTDQMNVLGLEAAA